MQENFPIKNGDIENKNECSKNTFQLAHEMYEFFYKALPNSILLIHISCVFEQG